MTNLKTNYFLRQSFFLFLIIRLLYWLLNTKSSFSFLLDSYRYDKLSNQILQGNFDLDTGPFLVAPFYPWLMAGFKAIFGHFGLPALSFVQILMEALAGVFLLKMAILLWGNRIFLLRTLAILYAFYPLTFFYCYSIGQESLFQSTLIISLYFYLKTCFLDKNDKDLILFSALFSFCFLTKAHILLFAPFAVLVWYRIEGDLLKIWRKVLIFALISLSFTLPNGVFNLKKHHIYTLSSDGTMLFFWYGNSPYAYDVYVPQNREYSQDSAYLIFAEGERFRDDESAVSQQRFAQLPTYAKKHQIFRDSAINWIKQTPNTWFTLKKYQIKHFLIPGVTSPPYAFSVWLAIFCLSFPLYFFAYLGFYLAFREEKNKHFWMLYLYLFMLVFSIIFGLQNRFRIITLEPFFMLYAAFGFIFLLNKSKLIQKEDSSV
jgi:hypothetical protein